MHRLTTTLILLFCILQSHAQPPLQKAGEAEMRVLFWHVYNSSLYTMTGTYEEYQPPLRLDISYQRSIRAEQLIRQTKKEWEHLGLDKTRYRKWLTELRNIWPDVRKGDRLSAYVSPDGSTHFSFNDKPVGQIKSADFSQQFIAIWLSPDTSHPEHRMQLIGGESR